MIKYGMGCIRSKGDGVYQLIVTIGKSRGKPKRFYKTVHCDSADEARDELAVFHDACKKNAIAPSSVDTFGEYCKKNLEKKYKTGKIKRSTYAGNLSKMNCYFKNLWNKKIKDISVGDIQLVVDEMSETLSPKTVRNVFSIIKTTLRKAVLDNIILVNPATGIELPSWRRKEAEYYDSEEVKRLIKQIEKAPLREINYKVAIFTAIFGGPRKGELCGLNEEDIDFNRCMMSIKRNRIRCDRGGLYEDSTKTLRSDRTISMPKHIVDLMSEVIAYNEKQARKHRDIWQGSPALFKNEVGAPISPQSLYRWLIAKEEEAGLKHVPLHGLRHTHVAMLADDPRYTIEQISQRIGHSSTATTMRVYMHLFSKRHDDIGRDLDDKYFG